MVEPETAAVITSVPPGKRNRIRLGYDGAFHHRAIERARDAKAHQTLIVKRPVALSSHNSLRMGRNVLGLLG